jgi:hypothetical protein
LPVTALPTGLPTSTRRNATVTSSLPLASNASSIKGSDPNFPVPVNSRE